MDMAQEEIVELDGTRLYVHPQRYAPEILRGLRDGWYEQTERRQLGKFLAAGDRVIEIGSGLGLTSMVCAHVVGESNIVSYDADPDVVEDARKNTALNGKQLRFVNAVFRNAMNWGGPEERAEFYVDQAFWASSLVKRATTVRTVSVPVLCLEREIRAFGANALVLDIEGGECELLELADLGGIRKLALEFHPNFVGHKPINRLIRKLIRDGYSIDVAKASEGFFCFYYGLTPG
jgi:FkbM family methyltransferase